MDRFIIIYYINSTPMFVHPELMAYMKATARVILLNKSRNEEEVEAGVNYQVSRVYA